ncbi:hypothetical protein PCASD_23010 [Puccinia coronata f. sp. avenae]|uniref:Uncharacterized protein n=1 Tax=Puccinia coronata f. sp. avenae TaxID=200324 RepID=A0A2N5TN05_9BASI|nr:hypothetical protein PCASD_23010 [Puccinia coronata f. sp. avenae]
MYLGLMEETVEKNKSKKGFKVFPTRLKGALENCWYTIQQLVGKFCGFYAQVKRRLCSGANHDNICHHKPNLATHNTPLELPRIYPTPTPLQTFRRYAALLPPSRYCCRLIRRYYRRPS